VVVVVVADAADGCCPKRPHAGGGVASTTFALPLLSADDLWKTPPFLAFKFRVAAACFLGGMMTIFLFCIYSGGRTKARRVETKQMRRLFFFLALTPDPMRVLFKISLCVEVEATPCLPGVPPIRFETPDEKKAERDAASTVRRDTAATK